MPDGIEKNGFRPDYKIENIAGWHIEIKRMLRGIAFHGSDLRGLELLLFFLTLRVLNRRDLRNRLLPRSG